MSRSHCGSSSATHKLPGQLYISKCAYTDSNRDAYSNVLARTMTYGRWKKKSDQQTFPIPSCVPPSTAASHADATLLCADVPMSTPPPYPYDQCCPRFPLALGRRVSTPPLPRFPSRHDVARVMRASSETPGAPEHLTTLTAGGRGGDTSPASAKRAQQHSHCASSTQVLLLRSVLNNIHTALRACCSCRCHPD